MPGRKQGRGSRLKAQIRHEEAHIKRTTARIVRNHSHRDREKYEYINKLTPGQVLHELVNTFTRYLITDLIEYNDMFEMGEVISDHRGTGSQQKMTISKQKITIIGIEISPV